MIICYRSCVLASILLFGGIARAQEDTPMPESMSMPPTTSSTPMQMTTIVNPLAIPDTRDGGGTSWLPDSTPMYAIMRQSGPWQFMYHGAAHLLSDQMNGPRGDRTLSLPNWEMMTARRNVGMRNQWKLAAMLSLDPLTVGGSGYPLLLQTGESWHNQPLKDHQHPHNFFSELSATYTHLVTPESAVYLYAAPVGQPALGPVAYMHRTFALDDPLSPIGHHWQDSTHISYGVVTAGYQTRLWQAEVSTFNGREPGENRFAFEKPTFDSFSGRLSANPSSNLALQASFGYRKSPEALHPEENDHRISASVIYNHALPMNKNFQTTFVWGRDVRPGRALGSYLLEGALKQDGGWTPYVRYEYIRKDAEELVLPASFPPTQIFNLHQLTLGVARDLPSRGDFQWGVGAQLLLNTVPKALAPVYGHNPTGWVMYVRLYPKRMP